MVAQELKCSYLQTDYLASALSSKMTEAESLNLFGEKFLNKENRRSNEVRFSVFSNQEQIDLYHKKALWNRQWIKNIIDYAIADQEDYVLEWYHLWPDVVAEDIKNRWDKVTYVLLYKSDVQEIEKGIKSHSHPNDRARKTTIKDETYWKIASFIYDFGQNMKKDANRNWLKSYDMSQWDFFKNLEKVKEMLIR